VIRQLRDARIVSHLTAAVLDERLDRLAHLRRFVPMEDNAPARARDVVRLDAPR
jgi:hypothetical protein